MLFDTDFTTFILALGVLENNGHTHPSVRIFSDGSGRFLDTEDRVIYHFDNAEEVERVFLNFGSNSKEEKSKKAPQINPLKTPLKVVCVDNLSPRPWIKFDYHPALIEELTGIELEKSCRVLGRAGITWVTEGVGTQILFVSMVNDFDMTVKWFKELEAICEEELAKKNKEEQCNTHWKMTYVSR